MNRSAALSRLWTDSCTVIVRREVTNPSTKITDFVETVPFQDQPCKLSFESLTSTSGDQIAIANQSAKLFLSADLEVPAGSKILVTRGGITFAFCRSGLPGLFSCHQEIMLEPFRRWA